MHEHRTTNRFRSQTGFALITGLLLLIVMSLIGVTMMNVTRLETMMAGGAREANISFQAAEAALRDGENLIERNTTSTSDFDGTAGRKPESYLEPDDLFAVSTWTDTDSATITGSNYPEISAPNQPRRIIKHLGDFTGDTKKAIQIVGYQQGSTYPPVSVFRVTSRGLSRDGTAPTVLQSYYGKIY